MVALVFGWHESHEAVTREVEGRIGRGDEMVIAAPALVESYAVLTRLPAQHRVSPAEASRLLNANFMGYATIALRAETYRSLVLAAPRRGIAGGALYDAVILECALAAGAHTVLTLNGRQFSRLAGDAVTVVVPSSD